MGERPYVLLPLCISIFLYCSIIFSIIFVISSHEQIVKRYTSKKDDFMEVSIVMKKKTATKSTMPKKPSESKPKTQELKKAKKVAFKSLFGKIKPEDLNISNEPKKRTKPKKSPLDLFNEPSKKASELAKSLKLAISSSSKSSSKGEYDKFRGKVQEILDEHWNSLEDTGEVASALVKINIDMYGTFSYTIVNLSYNSTFNERLKEFLENMKDVQFPENTDNVGFLPFKFSSQWSE